VFLTLTDFFLRFPPQANVLPAMADFWSLDGFWSTYPKFVIGFFFFPFSVFNFLLYSPHLFVLRLSLNPFVPPDYPFLSLYASE